MPKGLKSTSSVVAIGFSVTESAINTFTQEAVDLNLDPLNREVFVVMAIDLDPTAPDMVAGTNTATSASLTTTSQTAVQSLANSNCMSNAVLNIRSTAAAQVAFQRSARESPSSLLEYLGIIATNDFFVQISGNNNTLVKSCSGKLYGYRARADASIYAALVQSEVLSA
jgi:hypothetical protein